MTPKLPVRDGEDAPGDQGFVASLHRGSGLGLETAHRLLAFMGLAPMNPAFRRQVEAFLEAGMSRRRLARNFDIAESEVQRMLNPDHATMTATIDRALLKSGKLPNVERGREQPSILR